MSDLAIAALLLVRVYHGPEVSTEHVQAARLEAESIFHTAGIGMATIDCSSTSGATGPCAQPLAPGDLVLRLKLAGVTRGRRAVSMGFANVNDGSLGVPVLATVFVDRVALVARESGVEWPQLLGRAMAHEIGHLLLNDAQHADHGLMRATWSGAELRREHRSDWKFLNAEAVRMRAGLVARADGRPRNERLG
jgi:hypothetical protein